MAEYERVRIKEERLCRQNLIQGIIFKKNIIKLIYIWRLWMHGYREKGNNSNRLRFCWLIILFRLSSGIPQDFTMWLIPAVTLAPYQRSDETSLCSIAYFLNILHYLHRRVLHGCFSGSSPLLLPSPCVTGSALSCSPFGANISALPCLHSKPLAQQVKHFILRAAVLHSFLRRIQRFGTSGHPDAPVAS